MSKSNFGSFGHCRRRFGLCKPLCLWHSGWPEQSDSRISKTITIGFELVGIRCLYIVDHRAIARGASPKILCCVEGKEGWNAPEIIGKHVAGISDLPSASGV
jgi:hypothetical protein